MKIIAEQTKLVWAEKKEFTIPELFDLAQDLISRTWIVDGQEFNLRMEGWNFGFNTRKGSLGVCRTSKRKIELSYEWMSINTTKAADMEDVIRHEIAHAIDYHKRGYSDHSRSWKRVCVQVGALPERLHRAEAARPKAKYTLKCNKCGTTASRHRMDGRDYSCGSCGNGKFDPKLKLEIIKNW